MAGSDSSEQLQARVQSALRDGTRLCIRGGDSKAFYGREAEGEAIDTRVHHGIVSYEPTELVISARAGTPLREIEAALAANDQLLPFEPPHFGAAATLGGTIACNLSGPRRPYAGAARDFVLGSRVLNGKGEILRFGGEVMKNVAGYDVSRLMCGALGTLGLLLEVSLKVLPRNETEVTLVQDASAAQALERLHAWSRKPLPISASCQLDGRLYLRLSGTAGGIAEAQKQVGGDPVAAGAEFWDDLKEQRVGFFESSRPLWRLSLASDTPPLDIAGDWLYEWDGAQRWLLTDVEANHIRDVVSAVDGHATAFRNNVDRDAPFQPLPEPLMRLHRQLKQAFDPNGVFNRGRMYRDL